MLDPYANADAWNQLIVAGTVAPGTFSPSGHKRTIGWDVKDAAGQDGATSTRKGSPIGKFTGTHTLSDNPGGTSDFAEWEAYEALLRTSYGSDPPLALELIHPDLNRNGWTSACVAEIGEMVLDGKGGGKCAIGWIQYAPPKPKPASGASGGGEVTGTSGNQLIGPGGYIAPDDPNSPSAETAGDKRLREAEEELAELEGEANEL